MNCGGQPEEQGGSEYSAIRQNKEAVGQQRLSLDQVRDQVRANVTQRPLRIAARKSVASSVATAWSRVTRNASDSVRGSAAASTGECCSRGIECIGHLGMRQQFRTKGALRK
jgi:hypothetical protein